MTTPAVTVPPEIQAKFPKYIELILGSESMNDEERQYWINILPIMTPEQLKNLQDILENEKKQLAAIDRKYAQKAGGTKSVEDTERARKHRREERSGEEAAFEEEDRKRTDALLEKISEL